MFSLDFWHFFFAFPLWNKVLYETVYILRISCTFLHFHRAEAFSGCYDKSCLIKWYDFCLSRTLGVIFKSLINSERWIITGGDWFIYIYIYIVLIYIYIYIYIYSLDIYICKYVSLFKRLAIATYFSIRFIT